MGEGFEPGGAVLGFVHFGVPKPCNSVRRMRRMMRVIVDDKKAQTIEIDTDHGRRTVRNVVHDHCCR